MTDKAREAGPDKRSGPDQEQVVIKDKRKIDASGQAKAGGAAPDATMGQPGTPVAPADNAAGANADPKSDSGADPKSKQSKGRTSGTKAAAGPTGDATVTDAAKDAAKTDAAKADAAKAEAAKTDAAKAEAAKAEAAKTGAGEGDSPVGGGTATAPPAEKAGTPAGKGPLGAELQALRSELDERVRDLQRVTAEYANYRKRVERDRGVMAEQAMATVIGALLPILDDLDRAREHGDLVGPFAAVAEQLNSALGKFGLTAFGEKGDPFDPTRHEAVAHRTSAEVTEPTCVDVMRRGYLLGERLLRAAMVAVADPE